MKLLKAFKHAMKMVMNSKLRSWLTILGIVIGVAAVIAIVAIGEGLRQDVNSRLGDLGGDILTVTAGASKASEGHGRMRKDTSRATEEEVVLDRNDFQALKGLSDVKLIDRNIRGSVDVYYLGTQGSAGLIGVDPLVWAQITTNEAGSGRLLGPADTNVVVIGYRLANEFFDSKIGLNQMITIEDRAFRVVGILDDESTSIIMPLESAYSVLEDKEKDVYDSIVIIVRNEDELELAMENIDRQLMTVRHVTPKDRDFTVTSSKQQLERINEVLGGITLFLTAIAAVALLVGAVGIANTMFTSVLEKTKEIGIMKAIGAKNKDILTIFLLNSALIGLIGGILGVILGTGLSSVLPVLLGGGPDVRGPQSLFSSTLVTPESVAIALGIAVGIGVLSGMIPAWQASKLKPVDALRYE